MVTKEKLKNNISIAKGIGIILMVLAHSMASQQEVHKELQINYQVYIAILNM